MKRYLSKVIVVGMVCLCLTSPAFAQTSQETPESVAKASFAAMQAGDWATYTRLMHPDGLAAMKRKIAVEVNADKSGQAAKEAVKLLRLKSLDEFARLSDAAVFERFLAGFSTPELKASMQASTQTVLGKVPEGPDLVHVVSRLHMNVGGAWVNKVDVTSLKKYGTIWRLLMNDEMFNGVAGREQPMVYAYPAKGETAEQQSRDLNECQSWAKQQTGFDPTTGAATGAAAGGLAYTKNKDGYDRAFAACMQGRGYVFR